MLYKTYYKHLSNEKKLSCLGHYLVDEITKK